MLSARPFAALAAITFVVLVLGRLRILPPEKLWLYVGNTSFGAFYWQLFIVLICTFFGFAYFGVVRLTQHPLNPTTGLVGFLLVAFASVVWLISSFFITVRSLASHRITILLFTAMACFVVGVAFSAANVAWALLRR